MHATEIVVGEMQSHGGFQMRQFLAERIREPRKAPHCHAHRKVLPFHERRTDMIGIRIAKSNFVYNPEMRGGEYLASGLSNCP
jgi:hypothetical protein